MQASILLQQRDLPNYPDRRMLRFSLLRISVILAWLLHAVASYGQPVDLGLQGTGKTTTQWVGGTGGQLKLPLASGGSAVLTIPKRALPGSTLITMSEVKLASPMKGLNQVRGIKLEPDGLEFATPYTLEITLPAYAKAKLPVAVGYSGAGQQAHLYPSTQKTNTLSVQGDHFSGYIFSDAEAEAARVFEHAATDLVRARIDQQIAGYFKAERQCQLNNTNCKSDALSGDLFCKMREEFIKPLIAQAQQPNLSCNDVGSISSILATFVRNGQLLGVGDQTINSMAELLSQQANRCKAEAVKICRQTGDPGVLMQQFTAIYRQNVLLGASEEDLDFNEGMKQCGTYSVKVTTRQKTFVEDINFRGDGHHLDYTIDFETPWTDGENKSLSSSMQFDLSGAAQGEPATASLWITEYKHELKTKERDYAKDGIAQPLEKAKIKLSFLPRALKEPMRTSYSLEKKHFETDALVHIVEPGLVTEKAIICTRDRTCGDVTFYDWHEQFRIGHRKLLQGDVVTFPVPIRGLAPDIGSKTFASPRETGVIGRSPHYVQETTDVTLRFQPATTPIDEPASQPARKQPLKPGVAATPRLRQVQCPG